MIGHATLRRHLVDYSGEDARSLRDEILRRYPGHARQVVDCIRPQRLMQLIRRDRLVLPGPDPRVDHVAMPVLLEPLHQAAQTAEKAALRLTGRRLRRLRLTRHARRLVWRGRAATSEEAAEIAGCACRKQSRRRDHQRLGQTPAGYSGTETSSRSPT